MLLEMIRAEWDRRRATFLLLLAVWLTPPLLYASVISGGATADEVAQATRAMHLLLSWAMVVVAAAWGSGAWAPERKGRWAWFLALPVDRVRLFGLRYAAGLAWLALAAGALAVAAYTLAATAVLPFQLFAYPGAFTAWAAVAGWTAYTAGFVAGAWWEHPGRAAGMAFLALVALLYVSQQLAWYSVLEWIGGGTLSPFRALFARVPLLGG